MRVTAVDPRRATEGEVAAMHGVRAASLRQDTPWAPVATLAEFRAELAAPMPDTRMAYWLSCDGDSAVGLISLTMPGGPGADTAHIHIDVVPGQRRLGAGRQLLSEAVRLSYSVGRSAVLTRVPDSGPGSGFAAAMGCRPAYRETFARLALGGVDLTGSAPVPPGYELVRAPGPADAEQAAGIARVRTDGPGPCWIQAVDRVRAERGVHSVRVLVRDRGSGVVVGVTEAFVSGRAPVRAEQGMTVVAGHARRLGLGRAAVTELIRWLREDRPEVRELSCWVPGDQQGRRGLGGSLGYQEQGSYTHWAGTVAELTARLGMR